MPSGACPSAFGGKRAPRINCKASVSRSAGSGCPAHEKRPINSQRHPRPAYASSVSTSSLPASYALPCDPSAFTKVSRAARASDSFSAKFAFATEIINLIRLSWFTSDAPGS